MMVKRRTRVRQRCTDCRTRNLVALVLLALIPRATRSDTTVRVVLTGSLGGSVFGVDLTSTTTSSVSCWRNRSSASCDCVGGSDRIIDYVDSVRNRSNANDTVVFDVGGYVYGASPLNEQTLLRRSKDFFDATRYDGLGADYRDFATTDGNISEWSASMVATNVATRAPYNTSTRRFQIIESATTTSVAMLVLVDPTPLRTLGLTTRASAFDPYDRAMARAIADLRRNHDSPRVIGCVIPSMPSSSDDASSSSFLDLLEASIDVDIFFVGPDVYAFVATEGDAYATRTNWAGDLVGIVPLSSGDRGALTDVTATFDASGLLVSLRSEAVALTCDATRRNNISDVLDALAESVVSTMYDDVVLSLHAALSGTRICVLDDDESCTCDSPSHLHLYDGASFAEVCGCAVADCELGHTIADAMRAFVSCDLALVPSLAIRGGLERNVTRAQLFDALSPDMEIAVLEMSGSALASVIARMSLEPLATLNVRNITEDTLSHSTFLQFSENIRVAWHLLDGAIELDEIEVDGAGINASTTYRVALPYAAAGDVYDWVHLLANISGVSASYAARSGHAVYEAVLTTTTMRNMTLRRIVQGESVTTVNLGMLCTANPSAPQPSEIEECDHARIVIDLLNDKTDGFLDDILTNVRLNATLQDVGCVIGSASSGLQTVRGSGDVVAVLGPGCSTDVATVTSTSARSASGWGGVLLSPSSTAPSLDDHAAYPNLVRLATAEQKVAEGLRALASFYDWTNIAIIHTSSDWGNESAQAFVASNSTTAVNVLVESVIAIDAFDALDSVGKEAMIEDVLDSIIGASAYIVYVMCEPRVQRFIFRTVFRTRKLFGVNHAWITGWISEAMLVDDATGEVDLEAVTGALGVVGLIEYVDTSSELATDYIEKWGDAASVDGCTRQVDAGYCDSDGVPSTISGYGAQWADSVIALAMGLDANASAGCARLNEGQCNSTDACVYGGGACTVRSAYASTSLYDVDPSNGDLLYYNIAELGPFEGIGSPRIFLSSQTGGRLGSFAVQNLRLVTSSSSSSSNDGRRRLSVPLSSSRGRSLSVSLESTFADFVDVGLFQNQELTFSASNGSACAVQFPPGDSCVVPDDTAAVNSSDTAAWSVVAYTLAAVGGGIALGTLIFVIFFRRYQKRNEKMAEAYENERAEMMHRHLVAKVKNLDDMRRRLIDKMSENKNASRRDDVYVRRWILSPRNVHLHHRETGHTGNSDGTQFSTNVLCAHFEGEVALDGTRFDATIRTVRAYERTDNASVDDEVKTADTGTPTSPPLHKVEPLIFDAEAVRQLETVSKSDFFPLFIGIGTMRDEKQWFKRSYFIALEACAGSHRLHDLLWEGGTGERARNAGKSRRHLFDHRGENHFGSSRSLEAAKQRAAGVDSIDIAQKLQWTTDIVSALHHLHKHGLTHSNLSSFNVRTTASYLLNKSTKDDTSSLASKMANSVVGGNRKRRKRRRTTFLGSASEIGRNLFGGMTSRHRDITSSARRGKKYSRCILEDPIIYVSLHKHFDRAMVWKKQHDHPTAFLWQAPEVLQQSEALAKKFLRRSQETAKRSTAASPAVEDKTRPDSDLPSWASDGGGLCAIEMRALNARERSGTLQEFRSFNSPTPGVRDAPEEAEVEDDGDDAIVAPERTRAEDIFAMAVVLYEIFWVTSPWHWAKRSGWSAQRRLGKRQHNRAADLKKKQSTKAAWSPTLSIPESPSSLRKQLSGFSAKSLLFGHSKKPDVVRREIVDAVLRGKRPQLELNDSMKRPKSVSLEKHRSGLDPRGPIRKLIRRCWRQDPNARPSMRAVASAIDAFVCEGALKYRTTGASLQKKRP